MTPTEPTRASCSCYRLRPTISHPALEEGIMSPDSVTAGNPASNVTPKLGGKTAIVTGSTSGIGLGIARALAECGANIVINGFGPKDEIEKIRAAIAADYKV